MRVFTTLLFDQVARQPDLTLVRRARLRWADKRALLKPQPWIGATGQWMPGHEFHLGRGGFIPQGRAAHGRLRSRTQPWGSALP